MQEITRKKPAAGQTLRQLAQLYKGRWGQLICAVFWFVIKHSPVFITPVIIANIINIVTAPEQHTMREFWLNIIVGCAFIIQNIFSAWMQSRAYSRLVRSIEMELRGALVHKLQRLSIQFHTQSQSGRLLSKVMRDVENVEQMLDSCFNTVAPLLTGVIAAVVVTAYNNPAMLWLYLLAVPVAGITVGAFRRPVRKFNGLFRQQMERTQAAMSEMLEMVPVARAYGLSDRETRRMDELLNGVRETGFYLDTTNVAFGATSWVVFQLFQLLCLAFTGMLALRKVISPGEVVLYQNYFGQIVSAVSGVVNLFPTLARGMESMNSINEVLTSPDEEHDGAVLAPVPLRGEVDFENVVYRYPDADAPVLNGFSLHVPAGTSVAFVGPSGAGKSTLLNLVLGFCSPDKGVVRVDGIDLEDMELKSYRQQLAVVPQNTVLFSGTLRDNIAYAAPDATDEDIWNVIDEIGLRETVEKLPDGIYTNLAEHGGNFSGGQRQRIAIARALIRRPRLIIFDEATSALDSETEKMVSDATARLMGHCTTFLVAHRLSTIRSADLIVVVEDGHIVEQGSYDELMEKQGRFYELKILQR